jgi:hypothetical protein
VQTFAAMHESASGTKRTWHLPLSMSALGGKADISLTPHNVRLLPKADVRHPILL